MGEPIPSTPGPPGRVTNVTGQRGELHFVIPPRHRNRHHQPRTLNGTQEWGQTRRALPLQVGPNQTSTTTPSGAKSDEHTQVRGRADNIVVLDLPRWRVMTQIVSRTLGRSLLRRELWNGNREGLGNFLRWDPEQNIIRWAWTRYHPVRRRYLAARENGDWDHAEVVWLRSHREAGRWLDSLQPPEPPGPGGE